MEVYLRRLEGFRLGLMLISMAQDPRTISC